MKADAGRIFSFIIFIFQLAVTPVQLQGLSLKRPHQVLIGVHHLQPPPPLRHITVRLAASKVRHQYGIKKKHHKAEK